MKEEERAHLSPRMPQKCLASRTRKGPFCPRVVLSLVSVVRSAFSGSLCCVGVVPFWGMAEKAAAAREAAE